MLEEVRSIIAPSAEVSFPMIAIGAVLIAIAAGVFLHFLIFRTIRGLSRKSRFSLWKPLYENGRHSSLTLIVVLAIIIVKPLISFSSETLQTINHIIALMLVVVLAWSLLDIVTIARLALLSRYDVEQENNLRARKVHTQFRMLDNILKFLIIILAIGIGLMTFESIRHFGVSLLASAGIAGLVLGFAAQKLIATILAGLQIAITQPIRLDDVVIVEGEWGKIEEMTLTYVVVRIWDQRRLIVPTTYFIETPFQNWTRVSASILGTVFIYTDYTVPVDALRQELTNVVESSKHWDGQVNVVQVTDAKERTMEIRALVSAADSGTAFDLRVEVREKLIAFLQKNYPQCLPTMRMQMSPPDQEPDQDTGDVSVSTS